jgi:hypothetical protein
VRLTVPHQQATSSARRSASSSIRTMLDGVRWVPEALCGVVASHIISVSYKAKGDAQTHDVIACGWCVACGMRGRASRPFPAITTKSMPDTGTHPAHCLHCSCTTKQAGADCAPPSSQDQTSQNILFGAINPPRTITTTTTPQHSPICAQGLQWRPSRRWTRT